MECPICKSKKFCDLLYRKECIPFQNKLFTSYESAINCERRELQLDICEICGFVFNSKFDERLNLYDQNYNNSQGASEYFDEYVNSSITYIEKKYLKNIKKVVEIGCGRYAEYLKKMWRRSKGECEFLGYDPAYVASGEIVLEKFKVYPMYFDLDEQRRIEADCLISRHVIEHISQPMKLLTNVTGLNVENKNAFAFFETPDVRWSIKNNVLFDFVYEHCSLFSPSSIYKAAQILDINVCELLPAFNNQYMWIFMNAMSEKAMIEEQKRTLEDILLSAEGYKQREIKIIEYIQELLVQLKKLGEIAIWGIGAKGNTFLNLFDSKQKYVDYVIDINSTKWGKYVAGTGHVISGPDVLVNNKVRTVIVMNTNYYNEIIRCVKTIKVEANVLMIEDLLKS